MKEKNYWTLGIIAILISGVFIVSLSIFIALKNPVQNDNIFFAKKNIIDEHINQIIQEQKEFTSLYTPQISLDNLSGQNLSHFIFPYNTPAHRDPSVLKTTPPTPISPYDNQLTLITINKNNSNLSTIDLFMDSLHKEGELKHIGTLSLTSASEAKKLYTSEKFNLPEGRWKLILEITYQQNKKAYFESEVFVQDTLSHIQ